MTYATPVLLTEVEPGIRPTDRSMSFYPPGQCEYACRIPQNAELINQTSMSTDAGGHPYIATYWRNPDSDVPQYRIVWHDGVNWHNRQVSERKTPFSLKGGGTKMIPMSRPPDGGGQWRSVLSVP